MTTKRKTQLKRVALSWLCVAALAGGSVPAGLPGIVPAVTAAAEDTQTIVSTINLGKLVEYVTDPQNCPTGITASYDNNIGGSDISVIELTIKESGTYKLTGSNTTDVKIYAGNGVIADIVCENAYIKNTNGDYRYETSGGGEDQEGTSVITECTLSNYTYPFGTAESGSITLRGKLVVDTYTVVLNSYHQSTHFADENSHITADFTEISYYTNGKKDTAFYLNYAEYNASDYAGDCLCIKVNGNAAGVYTFTAGTDSVPLLYYNDDHSFDNDSDVCKDCGVEFVRYNVTFNDGSETPATERIINGRTVARPSDPTAPVGKKFTGWYADEKCTNKYNFENPVTGDITLYAGWEALSIQSIEVKTAPTKTSYIEGEKYNPTGLVITLTYDNGNTEDVAYSDSTKDGFTFAPETLSTGNKIVTITYGGKSAQQAVKVTPKSSGGSSGGSFGGGSSVTTTPTTTNPSIGGSSKSWSDVAADLGKLTSDSEATIELNGSTTVPVDVIKSIADSGSNVKLVINSSYAWIVDGADITAPAAADLTFTKTTSTKHDGLRGTEGTQFRINNTSIPTSLEISFKTAHAGKFANLYKKADGKLTFVTCAKLGEDGKVILPDVTEKGYYVAMLCEFSDRLGDMDNDGITNAKDASAILKDIVGLEAGKNPLMADFNGDGRINAMDASTILKRKVGTA